MKPGHERAFEDAYGPLGAWATLFAQGSGFLGTELLRDETQPRRYLTIDRWSSAQAFPTFKRVRAAQYEQLDTACNELTESERLSLLDRPAGDSSLENDSADLAIPEMVSRSDR